MLTHALLPLPAKAVVLLLGSYMDWSTPAVPSGFRSLADLEDDLSSQVRERALQRYLSEAVRLGLLVITSDPSPHRPPRYGAAIPTGEVAAPAATLPLEVLSPVDNGSSPARTCRCHPGDTCTVGRHHLHVQTPDPVVDPGKDKNNPPLVPPSSTGRPLLALVDGQGNPGGEHPHSAQLTSAPIPRHVELVTSGLIAALPDELGRRVVRRWEERATAQVARLLVGGWTTDRLVEVVVRPSWHGVANPGAVLVSRLQAIDVVPAAARDDRPSWCGECDEQRQREDAEGRMFRCPTCHPLAVSGSPF